MQRPLLLLALSGPFLLTSCAFSFRANATPPKAGAQAQAAVPAPVEPASAAELARIGLELARLEAAGSEDGAASAVRAAELELEAASAALTAFASDREVRTRGAAAAVERARVHLEEQRAELAELEAMYAVEEFAQTTKELVLVRGRNQLAAAEEALAIERMRLAQLEGLELPAEEAAHRLALMRAEADLRDARNELEVARVRARLDVLRAEQALHEAEDEDEAEAEDRDGGGEA
jgi:hypothetical protein